MAARRKSTVKSTKKAEVNVEVEKSKADKIWDAIQNLKIDVFALPDQKVSDYCTRADVIPDQLFLIVKGGAVIIALEDTLKDKGKDLGILEPYEHFVVEQDSRFVKIRIESDY
jgi:hypothetical protein